MITIEIVIAIIIEIATGTIVTQIETVMDAMIGIGTGIGEIAIAAIGTVIDSSLQRQVSEKTGRAML